MLAKASSFLVLLGALVALNAQPSSHAPAGLKVTVAARAQNIFEWTAVPGATSYQLERRGETGTYAAVGAAVTAPTAADTTIDVYATYTYHVRALMAGAAGLGAASNEVTIGPPPVGYNVTNASPKDSEDDYGVGMAMILDANDDPVFAWFLRDPNHNSHQQESILYFGGWDRLNHRWRKPLQIEVAGDSPLSQTPLALAMDASTGQLAMAWLRGDSVRAVAFSSDDGRTWTQPQTVAASEGLQGAQSCGVAMTGGRIFLAYFTADGPAFIWGHVADGPAKWRHFMAPAKGGAYYRAAGSLALDSAGKPAVALIANVEAGGVQTLFWRPGFTPVKVFDTAGVQNDYPDVRLVFAGTKPRMLFAGGRDTVEVHQIWFSASDTGAMWSEPVVVPNDGYRGMKGPMTMAINSKAGYAVVSTDVGGNWDEVKCGWPKLSLSTDGTHWSTCSPNPKDKDDRDGWTTAAYAGNDRLYLAYRNTSPNINALMVWHEGATAAAGLVVHK